MPQKPLTRRAQRTREEIYAAAMELFARHGVAKVSMQDIADKAETARSTVFKHYAQKHALLSEFFMRFADDALTNAKARGTQGFRSGMTTLFQAAQQEALKVEAILREVAGMAVGNGPLAQEEAQVDDQMISHICGLLEQGKRVGEVHVDLDVREAATLVLCVITETNHQAISQDRVKHLAADHQRRFDMLFRGLGESADPA